MPKFCSNCGAEVKEGYKFCLSCGKEIKGKPAKSQPAQTQQPQAQPQPTQPQQAAPPPVAPQQTYAPMQPKKSNTKLLFGIIAIIVVIVIVLVLVLTLTGGTGSSQFEGTWNVDTIIGDMGDQCTFYNNGTMKETNELFGDITTTWSDWRIEGGKVYLGSEIDYMGTGYTYTASNGGNTLVLKYEAAGLPITAYTLTKV